MARTPLDRQVPLSISDEDLTKLEKELREQFGNSDGPVVVTVYAPQAGPNKRKDQYLVRAAIRDPEQ